MGEQQWQEQHMLCTSGLWGMPTYSLIMALWLGLAWVGLGWGFNYFGGN